jgi:hypothetical protein
MGTNAASRKALHRALRSSREHSSRRRFSSAWAEAQFIALDPTISLRTRDDPAALRLGSLKAKVGLGPQSTVRA